MPAKFRSKNLGVRQMGHDGWHDDAVSGSFQMVPLDGSRFVQILADDNDEYRVSGGKGTVWISGEAQGFSAQARNDVVLPRSAGVPQRVAVYGKRSAFTRLFLHDNQGKVIDTLAVSVKKRVNKTYRMWLLADLFNTSSRTPAQVRDAMRLCEAMVFLQSNIMLTAVGGDATLIRVPLDLGNPMRYSIVAMLDLSMRLKAQPGPTADYDVVSTWKIEHNAGISAPILNVALVGDYLPGRDIEEASTFAHELCHTMGAWLHEDEADLLMSAGGSGTQMSRRVINLVNDTGRFA